MTRYVALKFSVVSKMNRVRRHNDVMTRHVMKRLTTNCLSIEQ